MKIELSDVTGSEAARFLEEVIDNLKLNHEQVIELEQLTKEYGIKVGFWVDEDGEDCVGG